MKKKLRYITLDIETESAAGSFDPAELEMALICIHDPETDAYLSFTKEELPRLWPILERADALIGYNSDHFDIPILNKYYPGDLTRIRSIDLLKEVREVLGRRLRLDNIAEATLGKKKSGSGLQAVQWWKEGKVDKVREYCIDDVRLTRALYDYAREHGRLKYRDFDGVRDIKLNTVHWEKENTPSGAMTHTLPF